MAWDQSQGSSEIGVESMGAPIHEDLSFGKANQGKISNEI
jgi:hypothetical protein